ncbi:MAG: ubiquinone/menaquinone biosynthesis methyltransferase [Deltaproteobacteria bacterium]|jgi:demethylmenaquinone methyltransferase/2-methoxy-6-polyprenyl-1,4-benzoquinol methylase|nr:ubiquinone/menaquinone biosynthesis methyltransferase [Deltaproteobacteria bacterium]
MSRSSRHGAFKEKVKAMFGELSPRYDKLNAILSFGRDSFWREALTRRLVELGDGARILDLATGTGDQLTSIRRLHPKAQVTGLDFSEPMLEVAKRKAAEQSKLLPPDSPEPHLVLGDVLETWLPSSHFDSVSMSFALRSLPSREPLYREVIRVLKPGGRFVFLELWHDRRAPWARLIRLHLEVLAPFAASALLGADKTAYQFLGRSIIAFPDPYRLSDELLAAGFDQIGLRTYTFGTAMLVWGRKPL